MQIEIENLNFSYDRKSSITKKVLNDISLTINEGEIFGIIGQTGSGKSTFIQHINGLIKADKTTKKLTVGEFNLLDKKCNFTKLRSKIGIVFQYPEYQLFAETVKEDVSFGLKNYFPDKNQAQVEKEVKEAIETVGLNYEDIKDKSPFELSGGQKRRVAIAGVLVTKPEILILDEPIVGLDPEGKKEFLSLVKNLHKVYAKTIIIVSHDMNLVAENCDRVAVFYQGEIASCGTPKDIFYDNALIEKCELLFPTVVKIHNELKDNGIVLKDIVKQDELVKEIENWISGGTKCEK